MADIDYGEVFGLDTVTETAGANDTPDTSDGVKEQEIATPDSNNDSNAVDTEVTAGADGTDYVQSAEDNSKYAAARRKAEAERDLAVTKAKEEAQAEAKKYLDEAFKGMGMTNPYTGKPITNKDEYDEYKVQFETDKQTRMLKKSGMSQEQFDEFIQNLPAVKDAQAKAQKAEAEAQKMRDEAAKARIDEQVKEIGKYDPDIKSVDDLMKSENYDGFIKLVKMGIPMVEAYRYANIDKGNERTSAMAKQQALNSVNSRSHLEKTATRGAGSKPVPSNVREQYLAFNPNLTDSEISAHYNKYLNNGG